MCFLRQCCTHSLCPTLWPLCSKTGSVLAMQFLCRSHGWTVVNHYYTQNWGLTMCFLRQCCTHCLCPSLWPLSQTGCSKTWTVVNHYYSQCHFGHGWTVVNHYYTQNWGLTMCFLRQCCTHFCAPHCGHNAPCKLAHMGSHHVFLRQCFTHSLCPTLFVHCAPKARSWPCSSCGEVMVGLW